jgi:hypothetical protein
MTDFTFGENHTVVLLGKKGKNLVSFSPIAPCSFGCGRWRE